MQELGEQRTETSRGWAIARFAALAVAFLLFDFVMTLLWRWAGNREMAFPQGVYIGLFVVQVDLLAFWVALGTGRMIVRFPWALLGITLMYVVHQFGASLFLNYRVSEAEQSLLVVILLFGLIASSQSLLVYRVAARRRLGYRDIPIKDSNRFHLRHLILGTSILSVTLAMLKGFGYPVSAPFTGEKNLLLALFVAAIVNLTTTVPSILVAFHASGRWRFWIGLLAGMNLVLSILEMVVLCLVLGVPPSISRAFLFLLQMNLTQSFVLLLSLLLVRCSGYQLRLVTKNSTVVPNTKADQAIVPQNDDPWSDDEVNAD